MNRRIPLDRENPFFSPAVGESLTDQFQAQASVMRRQGTHSLSLFSFFKTNVMNLCTFGGAGSREQQMIVSLASHFTAVVAWFPFFSSSLEKQQQQQASPRVFKKFSRAWRRFRVVLPFARSACVFTNLLVDVF